MSLKIADNKLLLQNSVDELWYQVYINVVDGNPVIVSGQDPVNVPVNNNYSAYATLLTPTGEFYKFQVVTQDPGITYSFVEVDPTGINRIILKGDDNNYYEIKIVQGEDGNFYTTILGANSSGVTDLCSSSRGILPASGECIREIITSIN